MPYGELTPEMEEVLRPLVAGQVVWDLGAGSGEYAIKLLELGASRVVAVEKEYDRWPYLPPEVEWRRMYFEKLDPAELKDALVLLAWPPNQPLWGLLGLLANSERVIYLGSNTSGSACGPQHMWDYLTFRTVEAHVPHHRNSLIVYGETSGRRPLLGEEVGATCGMVVGFEDAQETAAMVQEVARKS